MKTLKLSALALGMIVAGSAMAMGKEEAPAIGSELNWNYETAEVLGQAEDVIDAERLGNKQVDLKLEDELIGKGMRLKVKPSLKTQVTTFIKSHPKSMIAVAVVAVLGLGYAAYKKFTAKKKKTKKAKTETEFETMVVVE